MRDAATGHGHDESGTTDGQAPGDASSRTLAMVAAINLAGFAVELAGGLLFGSVALVSDAFHMLFDALAYVMAFAAAYVAGRYSGGDRWSYGLHRLEPLAAFLNGLLLLPMVGYILWESYQRFLQPVDIGVGPTLVIATGGLLVNVASVAVLGGGEMSLNERGAFYHLLGDAGGSIAVIVSTVVVSVTGITVVDPLAAGLIAVLVAWSAVNVLRGSGAIFLQGMPLDARDVREALESVDGVEAVTDFHAWRICSRITVATAHVRTSATSVDEVHAVNDRVHGVLEGYGVDHATVELVSDTGPRRGHLRDHAH